MHRNAFGDLVMSRDARTEAAHYYGLAEDLERQLEDANSNLGDWQKIKELEDEVSRTKEKLSSVQKQHYNVILNGFMKSHRLKDGEHIRYYNEKDKSMYIILRRNGKYWLYSCELKRYICEDECKDDRVLYTNKKNKREYTLKDLHRHIEYMIERNKREFKTGIETIDKYEAFRRAEENKTLKEILKYVDKVTCI